MIKQSSHIEHHWTFLWVPVIISMSESGFGTLLHTHSALPCYSKQLRLMHVMCIFTAETPVNGFIFC